MRSTPRRTRRRAKCRVMQSHPSPARRSTCSETSKTFRRSTARFVRFTVLSTTDGAEPCIDELEVFAPGGGENLARLDRRQGPRALSLLPGYSIHQIAHLNDGRYGNAASWISNERGKGWAMIELAKPGGSAALVWSRDNVEPVRYRDRLPLTYRVEVFDGCQGVANGFNAMKAGGQWPRRSISHIFSRPRNSGNENRSSKSWPPFNDNTRPSPLPWSTSDSSRRRIEFIFSNAAT